MLGLLFHIITPIILAIFINAIIFYKKWNNNNPKNKYLPPGWAIGMIWIVLLGLLGYAQWQVRELPVVYWSYSFIIIYCLLYPFYTIGFKVSQVMNVIALVLAVSLFVMLFIYKTKMSVIAATLPLVLWATYVNIVTLIKN